MKYLLPIDVPVWDDGRHLCNECPIWNDEHFFCQYDFNMEAKGCPLKPMPSKRKSMVEWLHKDTQTYESTSTMWTHEITEYDKGWNDCIEFLKGEDND